MMYAPIDHKIRDVMIFIFNLFSVTLLINAPNIMVGYGLIIPAMMISLLFTRPLKGAALFFVAHLLGSAILIHTGSLFTIVAILSLVIRSLVVFILAFGIEKGYIKRFMTVILGIVILDNFISLSLGLLYYAKDAIEVGLGIYSAFYIPFIYLSYTRYRRGNSFGAIVPLVYMVIYYFSAAYFYAAVLNIGVLAFLLVLYKVREGKLLKQFAALSFILLIGAAFLSMPYIAYNFDIAMYPYKYESWVGKQWLQKVEGPYCREGNVFVSTYDPMRLRILSTCVTVEGVVVSEINKVGDGDIVFDVKLDPDYEYMLSIGSWILREGAIHVEIVPDDQGLVTIPEKGDRVRIVGVWVVDTDHGSWSEIHPAWYIEVLE